MTLKFASYNLFALTIAAISPTISTSGYCTIPFSSASGWFGSYSYLYFAVSTISEVGPKFEEEFISFCRFDAPSSWLSKTFKKFISSGPLLETDLIWYPIVPGADETLEFAIFCAAASNRFFGLQVHLLLFEISYLRLSMT